MNFNFRSFSLVFATTVIFSSPGYGQDSAGGLPLAAVGDQVLVKREAVFPIDPARYRVSLVLRPHRQVDVIAPFDGVVRDVPAKVGASISDQGELARMENTEAKLQLQHANAMLKIASLETKLEQAADGNGKELAKAKVEAAEALVALADLQLSRATIRSPLLGEVLRVNVEPGQFVRAGDVVATVGDLTKLYVEVPADRKSVQKDLSFTVRVESEEVSGKVISVMPLSERFASLRDLFDSVISAQILIENSSGKYRPGQTVYVPYVPRHPVAESPTSAIGNLPDGQRRVQVVRQNIVRDIAVQVMGSVGTSRVYVSGPFSSGDEVIYESSHAMYDGFQLRPAAKAAETAEKGTAPGARPSSTTPSPTPSKTNAGF